MGRTNNSHKITLSFVDTFATVQLLMLLTEESDRLTVAAILYICCLPCATDRWTSTAYELQPLPKIDVSNLSTQSFDETYLDKLPLILSGVSICPPRMDFKTVQKECHGKIPLNYVHKKSVTEGAWAGLKAGDKNQIIDFNEWVLHMGKKTSTRQSDDKDPQFLFDVPMVEICPNLYGNVSIPAHFIGKFSSQFQYRKFNSVMEQQADGGLRKAKDASQDDKSKVLNELCTDLPFFNIYMAEESFQTDLHIDAGHTSFMASMCVGRKRWRVITNNDYAKIYEEIGLEGIPMNTKHIMGTIRSPFNTWSSENDNDLHRANVTVYEGILNSGELLYIPAGFPHAATTLDDSIMIASNDHTFNNLEEGIEFCDHIDNDHVACPGIRQKFKAFVKNKDIIATMNRLDTPLPQSTGCGKTYELLLDANENSNVIDISPSNFHLHLESGSLVILKSQKNCGFCLYLLNHWTDIISGYSTNVQFGVLNCFQGQCQYGENEYYQQLFRRLEGSISPILLHVSLDNSRNKLKFVDYYGQYSIDDIRVWASYNAGSSIILEPAWYKIFWMTFHAITYHTTIVIERIGSTGLGILLFTMIFFTFVLCAQLNNVSSSQGRRKRKQL